MDDETHDAVTDLARGSALFIVAAVAVIGTMGWLGVL